MKHLLLTTIAAVVLVGCGESQPKRPDISIHKAATFGNIEAVKQHLATGTDVNAKRSGGGVEGGNDGSTSLDYAEGEIADLLRKHGGKTGEELKGAGN